MQHFIYRFLNLHIIFIANYVVNYISKKKKKKKGKLYISFSLITRLICHSIFNERVQNFKSSISDYQYIYIWGYILVTFLEVWGIAKHIQKFFKMTNLLLKYKRRVLLLVHSLQTIFFHVLYLFTFFFAP